MVCISFKFPSEVQREDCLSFCTYALAAVRLLVRSSFRPHSQVHLSSVVHKLPSYPPINIPKANQRKYGTTIENIFVLGGTSLNKPYRIPTQPQCITRIQDFSLGILHVNHEHGACNFEKPTLLNKIIQHCHSPSNVLIKLSLGPFEKVAFP